ncbi:MAG TPA: cytochrome P450 [Aggregatilineales bacterium]|nr:cytochrome P450 [Anaerolineales bacterium]HRE47360.1 cytochrome P450 [Aggregatilineales bacterium]
MPPIPTPNPHTARRALRAILEARSPLAGLAVFARDLGNVYRITLPGFNPVMVAGAEACRWVLVEAREDLRWNSPGDPIAVLLREGLLVADGEIHDTMRARMNPALHKTALTSYLETMIHHTDRIAAGWSPETPADMLTDMRRLAMLILMETMFQVDATAELGALWRALLKTLQFISPGLWVISGRLPRPGYAGALRQMDDYLYRLIALRRLLPEQPNDLLGLLLATPGITDGHIRDQMLTMIIAGHDTSTGLLSWVLYLLGKHPDIQARARAEVAAVLGDAPPTMESLGRLKFVGHVIDETLRLYPPAHLGSRIAARDLEFNGYTIPAGVRVTYSIYVTHRHPDHWENPLCFDPDRFLPERSRGRAPYSFLPFGGGARNCIGAAFAQVEAKVILTRLLSRYRFVLLREAVHEHMAVTIEPRPGVFMRVERL